MAVQESRFRRPEVLIVLARGCARIELVCLTSLLGIALVVVAAAVLTPNALEEEHYRQQAAVALVANVQDVVVHRWVLGQATQAEADALDAAAFLGASTAAEAKLQLAAAPPVASMDLLAAATHRSELEEGAGRPLHRREIGCGSCLCPCGSCPCPCLSRRGLFRQARDLRAFARLAS